MESLFFGGLMKLVTSRSEEGGGMSIESDTFNGGWGQFTAGLSHSSCIRRNVCTFEHASWDFV